MPVTDVKTLTEQILGGDYEGHESEILGAIIKRRDLGSIQIAWRLEWDDLDVTQENLTIGEAKLVEKLAGKSIHLTAPAQSADNISAYLVAALVNRKGMSQQDALAEVDKASARQLFRSLSDYTIVDPPKDDGGQA